LFIDVSEQIIGPIFEFELQMAPINCTETFGANYQPRPCNIQDEKRPQETTLLEMILWWVPVLWGTNCLHFKDGGWKSVSLSKVGTHPPDCSWGFI